MWARSKHGGNRGRNRRPSATSHMRVPAHEDQQLEMEDMEGPGTAEPPDEIEALAARVSAALKAETAPTAKTRATARATKANPDPLAYGPDGYQGHEHDHNLDHLDDEHEHEHELHEHELHDSEDLVVRPLTLDFNLDTTANQRTQMAWVRTSLGMISLGVAIMHIFATRAELLALVFIVLGVLYGFVAMYRFYSFFNMRATGKFRTNSLCIWVTSGLTMLALIVVTVLMALDDLSSPTPAPTGSAGSNSSSSGDG